jgi:hypothetical protein
MVRRNRTKVHLAYVRVCRQNAPATGNVNDIGTKAQTFRYRSLLSERKQNV